MAIITQTPSTGTVACVRSHAPVFLSTIEPVRNATSVEASAHVRVRPGGVDGWGPQHVLGMFPADEQTKVQTPRANQRAESGPSPWRPPE